nr:uncharacterized protein LOC105722181 isoform X2 [Aotus nancymaae]XP_012314902.1 uncharacterized protein LOC105722181 isoform X2 [Aotus nancymaae]XP_012314903.1 uncharacterized protein LOC105722181 isoform X2 [Aotus nancymaae]XP_012314904.1 uncharacterized protein LOC105722181 isoform X2 [Aotus nancymaae]XP_012314906.1 uncharacterized protein LOC105722181 isoform X2 [Aotus nancymaae]
MWWLLTLGQGMPVHREAAQNQWASSPLLQVFLHTFLSFLHRSLCPPPPGIDSPARQALGKLEGSALQPLPATALLRPSSPSQTSQGKKGSIFPRADGLQPAADPPLTRRTHRPIPIHSFRQSYEAMSAHAHQAFFLEFKELKEVGKEQPRLETEPPRNTTKNHYPHVLPYR